MSAPRISVAGVHLAFRRREVLRGFDLAVEPGACVGLLGVSGSGKTTALRILAGLERPQRGEVRIGDEIVTGDGVFVSPHRRGVGLVFQDLALWPHLTARGHLDLVARALGLSRAERRARVGEWLERCRLTSVARQRPDQLSGGEQQRLALARTLLPEPHVLLLDEPFAACDRPLVEDLKALVAEIHRGQHLTTLMVSHDWRDMEGLVDSVAVLEAGHVAVHGTAAQAMAHLADSPLGRFFRC
ncbi:ATP-binding cassette domain-containing protein [Candidatus Sumerlaeota bacterium]|nr:ATP-binding cassette domain-containing protein [Candidatus Sumerlaeota bacterium]